MGWTKQGQLTIHYDNVTGKWYARQPVEVEPPHQPLSHRRAFVGLGVINLLTVALDGARQTLVYSGRSVLADWWYLSHRIDRLKSLAKTINHRKSTHRIRRLFRRRRLRLRQYVNTVVRRAVADLWAHGVSQLVVGDLTGILAVKSGGRKAHAMTHNCWSHRYLMQRITEVAEEYGIVVERVDERGTSSKCPRCRSKRVTRLGRLFKCQECRLEAHRDGVGVVNIGLAQGAAFPGEVVNGAVACPLEVSG